MEIELAGESVFPSNAISIYYNKMLILNPLNDNIYQNRNSHLLPYLFDFLIEVLGRICFMYQLNSLCVIMSLILGTTQFYNALQHAQGEIWCWSRLKNFKREQSLNVKTIQP